MIHKSHTKKDLIEIIEVFDFTDVITNYRDLNKDALVGLLDIHLRTIYDITPKKEYFDCNDVSELRDYLKHPSPKQVISIVERDRIVDISKKIIFYCRICGYCLGKNTYETIEEVITDAEEISKYGDIPTIRRALRLLQADTKIKNKISPVITYRTQQRLDRQKLLKKNSLAKMSVHHGHFVVKFG